MSPTHLRATESGGVWLASGLLVWACYDASPPLQRPSEQPAIGGNADTLGGAAGDGGNLRSSNGGASEPDGDDRLAEPVLGGGGAGGAGGADANAGGQSTSCIDGSDADADGLFDCDDDDDDDDGVSDAHDMALLDASVPPFNTSPAPNAVLADRCVQRVLAELEGQREAFNLPKLEMHRGHELPDMTGYYQQPNYVSIILISNDPKEVGLSWYGNERRLRRDPLVHDRYDHWGIGLDANNRPQGTWHERGHVHRGDSEGNFTMYIRHESWVHIESGRIRPSDGSIVDLVSLGLNVAADGVYENGCPEGGRWFVSAFGSAVYQRVEVDQLRLFCRDDIEDDAYFPREQWVSTLGQACVCSDAFETVCEGG